MTERNAGLTADVLFVAVTRPPMRWGVTFSALMFNLVFTMEAFLLTKNLLTLLVALPIHGAKSRKRRARSRLHVVPQKAVR
ncbi:MAG: hypothetical protein DMG78_31420 [Acidobacteria bacterium]|nr:MAG: hypothetical protein DMG78_31420 [Acidobacteriota bacterium]